VQIVLPSIMKRRCTRLHWAASLALLLCILGCRRDVASSGLVPIHFQTDWYPQPEHGGFYEALLKGYYRQEGLDVTILPGGPYNSVEQQVATGVAQFAMGSSDRVLEFDSQGGRIVAVEATMQQDPQAVMVRANSPIHTFADLDGHAIAAKAGATWFEYIVHRYNLKNVREVPATYSVANFLRDPNYVQQIFVTSEPFFAIKAGIAVRTLLISDTGYSPYRVVFTSSDYLRQHPDVVAKFVRASIRGWQDYLQDPSIVHAELLKLNPALDPQEMQFTWAALRKGHFVDDGDPARIGQMNAARWTAMYGQLSGLNLIEHPFDPAIAYTLRFVAPS
jgi:NitT/TauT family transport system substrate-binding protein